MRKLIVLRGTPGSGKSTWIKNNNFEPYTICSDDIRLLFRSPVLHSNGKLSIDNSINKRVWDLVFSVCEERMERGEFIVVDSTLKKLKDFSKYQKLADKYFYEMICVDFSNLPLNDCLSQNLKRPEYKQLPNEAIEKCFNSFKSQKIPNHIKVIDPTNKEELNDFLKTDIKDLNSYKKIHHIGDIQGCFEPIKEYFKDGFKDDEFYIFTGDYLDRGIQNGEVLEWLLKEVVHRDNVALMRGNHESHLVRYVGDLEFRGEEFKTNTLPQIQHINKQDIRTFLSKMKDCLLYTYFDKQVIISHGGVGKIPNLDQFYKVAGKHFWHGTGVYGDPIDEIFNNENKDWIQIHGHRNRNCLPTKASETSYNLEGKVEFGGCLRIVTIGKSRNG
jgi:predicted kinase